MVSEDEKLIEVTIPRNVVGEKRYLGIRGKNIREGLIMAAVIILIVSRIPFVTRIKIIFMVVLGIAAFFIGCIGIKSRSITEYITDYRTYRQSPKQYHLRTIKDAPEKKKKFMMQEGKTYIDSFSIETLFYKVRDKWKEFKNRYGFR